MADPFSITGGAVGVVSLAITVCQGLQWYVSGVKEAKDKAEQIAAETEELANLLELLESIVGKVNQSQSVSATRTGIVSCADAIATIRKKLKPDDQASNSGIKLSLKRLAKRLAFPFKEAEIKYWKEVLSTIQQSLQTALLALVIDQQRLTSEDIRLQFTQLSMGQSAQHLSSLQLQRDVFDRTHLQLVRQSHALESGFSATSHSFQSLHADIHSLQHTVQPIIAQTSHLGALPRLQSTIERMETKLNEMSLATDSTLETDVTNLGSLQRKTRRLRRRSALVTCTCRPQTSTLGYLSGLLALTCTRTSIHDTQCPRSLFQDAVTDLQLRVTLCSLVLRTKMSLTFALSYGAGLSLKHNLQCHRVVDLSSPAFTFVETLVNSSNKMSDESFRKEADKLLAIFQLRQASPHERLPDGRTLLHHLCHMAGMLIYFHPDESSFKTIGNLRYLVIVLLSHMSAEALETDDKELTCVDYFTRTTPKSIYQVDFMSTLLEHGLQMTTRGLQDMILWSDYSPASVEIPFKSLTNSLLNDNEILDAMLSQSDCQLRHALHQSRDSHTVDAETVYVALIAATTTGWIHGCKIVLETGILAGLDHVPKPEGKTLLEYSLSAKRLDLLQFWLSERAQDCTMLQLSFIGWTEDVLYRYNGDTVPSFHIQVIYLITQYVFNIRHAIKLLVQKHGITYCCDSARKNTPDAHVKCMLNALMHEGIDVPQHYWPRGKSLYYTQDGWDTDSLLVFEGLESVGFCEIAQESFECDIETSCSPLLYLATQSCYATSNFKRLLSNRDLIVQWFVSRGADLREAWPRSDTTVLHCLAGQSAKSLRLQLQWTHANPYRALGQVWTCEDFEFLVEQDILDSCACGCSSSGCGFLSCFWKEFFHEAELQSRFSLICDSFKNATLTRGVEGSTAHTNLDRSQEWVESEFLHALTRWVDKAASTLKLFRLIHGYILLFTFSYLELRHTCCDLNRIRHFDGPDYTQQPYPRYPPKELRRLTNEDAHLRKRLDKLVPELTSQYDSFGGKLPDFVIDVLIPKLRKTMEELKEEDKKLFTSGRRELGVVMYEDENEAEQENNDAEEEESDIEEEESDDEY